MVDQEPITNPQRKLFFGLFIFPLLIAVGMAVLLCTVVLLTNEEETPESLITAIKTGAPSKRWQKAFELSNELNRGQGTIRNDGVRREIIHILEDPEHYDPKTRSYMAMALSHFRGDESVDALRKVLKDESGEVSLYALWALGTLGAKRALPDVQPFLGSTDDQLRKMAVYVLGVLGDNETVNVLRPLLDDPVADVKWNAALSLARLGDDAGLNVLTAMLEREQLTSRYQMSDEAAENVMINAVKGLALLRRPESMQILDELSKNDKSLKVRQAALEALRYQNGQDNGDKTI